MHENCDFGASVNILTPFAGAPFSWGARHTTVCLNVLVTIVNVSGEVLEMP